MASGGPPLRQAPRFSRGATGVAAPQPPAELQDGPPAAAAAGGGEAAGGVPNCRPGSARPQQGKASLGMSVYLRIVFSVTNVP